MSLVGNITINNKTPIVLETLKEEDILKEESSKESLSSKDKNKVYL